jgi:hypothetical protein
MLLGLLSWPLSVSHMCGELGVNHASALVLRSLVHSGRLKHACMGAVQGAAHFGVCCRWSTADVPLLLANRLQWRTTVSPGIVCARLYED